MRNVITAAPLNSTDVQEKLTSLPEGQFVRPPGGKLDFSRRGFFDLYSGSYCVARVYFSSPDWLVGSHF